LTAGTPAPSFRLPRLDGEGERTLEEYRGRRLLLVFSDPACGPCDQLAPHLERVHRERTDLSVLMIGRREADLNRQKLAQLGLTLPVVLQKSWEISLLYGMFATPVAYLIDEHGVIAAAAAKGVEPILDLIAGAASPTAANGRTSLGHEQEALARSK
jgi:peroxiredoxin